MNYRGKKYFLDIAHMHPVCPLSLSHARVFVLADIWSRWKQKQGFSVRFPICMHYSGSTVFKITDTVSSFLKKQNLSDTNQKILDLIFNFYKIPKENLHKFADPIAVLDYFSNAILKDLKSIQVGCDYDKYFNTQNSLYQEFVRSIFDIYAGKQFIKIHDDNKSLDYPNPLFKNLSTKRSNETKFSPPTAKTMVMDSIEKLDNKWSFERENSIGTGMDGSIIVNPQFDSEFLSIFNAIYPYLKNLEINHLNIKYVFKEFLYKIENPKKEVSMIADNLYSNLQETLPVNKFIVERHLQNWVAKKIYTEAILLLPDLSTCEYFFIGSITKNNRADSASRGHGITLSHLIENVGPVNARLALLYTFDLPWKDHEWETELPMKIKKKTYKFINFCKLLKIRSVNQNFNKIEVLLNEIEEKIEDQILQGSIKPIINLLFDELPKIIYPLTEWQEKESKNKKNEQILNFLFKYLNILCPALKEKIYED